MNKIQCFFTLLFITNICSAQHSFYKNTVIQKIEIFTSIPNWDYRLDTLKVGSEEYLLMDSIKINGFKIDTVGLKYKGNSSYNASYIKNPIHIALDEFKNQNYKGITDIKLGNNYADPSLMREVLAYQILNKYMDCPQSNFAMLYINNVYIGLYANDEPIDKKFCANKFYSSTNTLIKCNPIVNPGTTSRCNLKYINADSTSYFNFYELKSKTGWNKFVKLCDTITNYPNSISTNLDLDRSFWMLAFNNATVNLDSYNGAFVQNYYLYEDNLRRFNPIVWDLNMAFGGFQFGGTQGAGGFGILNLVGMQTMSPIIHSTEADWPLIKNTLSNSSNKKKYFAHLRTIVKENFQNNDYLTTYAIFKSLIDTAVLADTNKFCTNTLYQNALDSTLTGGSKTPGIRTLMNARLTYLNTYPDLSVAAPSFVSTVISNTSPTINDKITITAIISTANTAEVYFYYRNAVTNKFESIPLYDDGNHNDGSVNDNIFANQYKVVSGFTQYYFYVENADAGMFSPERAEHEFYTLTALGQEPITKDIVINEFLADNLNGEKDEYAQKEDWIELYNTSGKLINLSNLYLSDDKALQKKWKFPANTNIAPEAYLIVWADDDSSQKIYHTNFNLNKDSGTILLSDATGLIIDSVSYKTQASDKSSARIPNGTGNFMIGNPSFGKNNPSSNLSIAHINSSIRIYPNPAQDYVYIDSKEPILNLKLFNSMGILQNQIFKFIDGKIDLSQLISGIYYLSLQTENGQYYSTIVKRD